MEIGDRVLKTTEHRQHAQETLRIVTDGGKHKIQEKILHGVFLELLKSNCLGHSVNITSRQNNWDFLGPSGNMTNLLSVPKMLMGLHENVPG